MIITQPDINLLSMTSPTYAKKNCYVSVAFFSSKKKKKGQRAFKMSYHTEGTRQGPWGGPQGNWDDERDPTSRTPAAASLLLWQWSPVL